jgi:hypothetical protein
MKDLSSEAATSYMLKSWGANSEKSKTFEIWKTKTTVLQEEIFLRKAPSPD